MSQVFYCTTLLKEWIFIMFQRTFLTLLHFKTIVWYQMYAVRSCKREYGVNRSNLRRMLYQWGTMGSGPRILKDVKEVWRLWRKCWIYWTIAGVSIRSSQWWFSDLDISIAKEPPDNPPQTSKVQHLKSRQEVNDKLFTSKTSICWPVSHLP